MEEKKEEVVVNEVIEEVKPEETTVIEEPEDVGFTKYLHITKETFYEFYSNGGIVQSIKSTLILCAIMCLIIYLFRDKSAPASVTLASMGIYCGIIIVVGVIMYFVNRFITIPNQYKRFGLADREIEATFTNKKITQTIDGQSVEIPWEQVAIFKETDKSLMFFGYSRSGFLLSKEDKFSEDELEYIRNIMKSKNIQIKK